MGKWEMGQTRKMRKEKKACAERENFMKSILNWIVQSTFSSHRRVQCPVCDKGGGVRGCGKFFERLPNKAPKHMAREHYYGRQRGVNAANGHNDKRNGHLDTQTQGAARRGVWGEGRGVTCIKLLIRFVGSREGEKWLCGSRVKVFVTGAFSIVARKFFEAAHELWRAAAHCQSWWRRRRRRCCCLSLSAPLSASQFFICLSVQLCVCVRVCVC